MKIKLNELTIYFEISSLYKKFSIFFNIYLLKVASCLLICQNNLINFKCLTIKLNTASENENNFLFNIKNENKIVETGLIIISNY